MATAKSLHIGLNYIDPTEYGDNGELFNCVNDANSMEALANAQGFQSFKLTDSAATSSNVLSQINLAANTLKSGDIFLLTYSGHGSQVPDESGDELDGLSETWCLYDRQLIDDELYHLWSLFSPGVRIFVSSDSCHSGTIVRKILINDKKENKIINLPTKERDAKVETEIKRVFNLKKTRSNTAGTIVNRYRNLPYSISMENYRKRRDMYRGIQVLAGSKNRSNIKCSLILISGCQDNQLSSDGSGNNGLFTQKLIDTWNNGNYSDNYTRFHQDILGEMPADQSPNYMTLGKNIEAFQNQRPYTTANPFTSNSNINSGQIVEPSVVGPVSWPTNNEPPEFSINRGGNPYFYFEITSDYRLFDYAIKNAEGNKNNFWASWENNINNRLTGDTFRLPQNVWNDLKQNSKLYYKIGTTSSLEGWQNHKVSIQSSEHRNAPYIQLTSNTTVNDGDGSNTGLSGNLRLSDSVGHGGANVETDVRIVQSLLNQLPGNSGGANPNLQVDGKYGSNTRNAIRRFQDLNKLEKSGLLEPNGSGFIILNMKARNLELCE